MWSQGFDRTFKNLFALEDDISAAVSKALAVKFAGAAQPLVAVATNNAHAHDLVLRARQLLYRGDETSLNQGLVLLNQALAEDAAYAEAWVGLSSTYMWLVDAYLAPIDALPVMKSAAEKAVALNPDLAEGHANLGYILLAYVRDFEGARSELDRAIALNPNSADAHFFLGLYHFTKQDIAGARGELQIATRLDPGNPFPSLVEVWVAGAAGNAAEATAHAQQVLALAPDFFYVSDPLVYAHVLSGNWQACVERGSKVASAAAGRPDPLLAVCYARYGNPAAAREILGQLEAAARTRYVDHSFIAAIDVALGENDAALAALDQADHDRSAMLLYLWMYPWFKPLQDDPRFRELLRGIQAGSGAP
jgi:serine/threonine-protein kinase